MGRLSILMMPWFKKIQQRRIERTDAAKCGCRWHLAFEGRKAFEAGKTPVDCPHPLGSQEQRNWFSGWIAAFDRRFT
jgi:hypothetical protein